MICGIVDLGSNTIRLSIYQYEGEHFRLLLNKKTMAGLAGYVQDGALSDGGILVACRVLSSYRALLSNFSVSEMHVFATASLRNISNTGEAVEAIREADLILLGPGSLYTSVIPNLLVEGVPEAIAQSDALKIYVCNIMTQDGETEGYTAGDHLEALMNHGAPGLVDLCLANSAPVQAGLVERYRAEDAVPLAVDRERVAAMGLELVERPVASEGGNFARHDPDKLAAAVLEIYRQRAVRIFQGKERYIIEE